MKIDVLGTPYQVRRVRCGQDEYMEKMKFGGYCDALAHEIVILDLKTTEEWKNENDAVIRNMERCTMRHELIHAFLNESGLQWNSFIPEKAWAKNEEMVDWLALQFPKMLKVFQAVDAI